MPKAHARIIAVANQKGGVGKSTTAVSLGAAIAELGKRVLVVDLDPQGNASTGLGIRHEARDVTVYDVLAAEAPIDGAIVPTPVENLFAIPSTIDLAGAEIELVSQFSRELRLRKALEPLKDGAFDYILLDCPPSLGLLTVNALAAAEELIVPIQCEYYALEGLGQLLRNVRLVQQNVNQKLRLTGIVMTMFDPRTKLSEQVVAEVRRYFGDRVYQTIIPRTVRLSEAPGFGQPITVYDPRSRGAQSYRDLAAEVVVKMPDDTPLPVIEDLPSVAISRPEPVPVRAPRPLVGVEDELDEYLPSENEPAEPEQEVEGSLEVEVVAVEVEEPEVDVEARPTVAAASSEGVEQPAAEGDPELESSPPAEDAPKAVEPEPAVEEEPRTREADAVRREEDEPVRSGVVEQGVERQGRARAERSPVILGEGEPESEVEPLETEPQVSSGQMGSDESSDDAAPKRRWGLFRRGA